MLENIINKLKESPLFNLSLGSKELFHSNFLYWLGNKYPNEFGKIFKKFLKIETDDNEAKDFQREKSNIDLSFKYKDGQQILIENKVKSIPYIEQLQNHKLLTTIFEEKHLIFHLLNMRLLHNYYERYLFLMLQKNDTLLSRISLIKLSQYGRVLWLK